MRARGQQGSRHRAFLILGLAFLPLGLTSSRAFLALSVVFLGLGIAGEVRNRREKSGSGD